MAQFQPQSTKLPPLALQENVLFYGDNLDILRRFIPDESIDLIYLDPPFNSKADYNILFKESTGEESNAQIRAFSDFWHWDSASRRTYDYLVSNQVDERVATVAESLYRLLGKNDMTAYLFMMAIRLTELHRVLKPSGSLFLHCDPTADSYLRLVLDAVFGPKAFLGEVIWRRTTSHVTSRRWARLHDVILSYAKNESLVKFHPPKLPADEGWVEREYHHNDEKGSYMVDNLTGAGTTNGPSGMPWKSIDPAKIGAGRHWRYTPDKLDRLDAEGMIYWPKRGQYPKLKVYRSGEEGSTVGDLWIDKSVKGLGRTSDERLGYPTQKPRSVLERIIDSGSDKGDWVLDPFCGCGTAIDAAEKLNRHWIGIDVTYLAVNVIKRRMRDSYPRAKFRVEGEPQELSAAEELAKDRYQFQWWALSLIGARPVGSSAGSREGRKGADEGIDGWLRFGNGNGHIERIVVQVKSGHVGVKDIRELRDVVSRQHAAIGLFITLEEPTSEMVKEERATDPFKHPTWQHEYPAIQILTIADLLKGKVPDIPPTINPFQEAQVATRRPDGSNETLTDSLTSFDDKRDRKGYGRQGRLTTSDSS